MAASEPHLMGRARKLHHLSVSVSDLKMSAAFYQKLFGFPPIRSLPPPGSETYGWNFNGHILSLTRTSKEKAGKISHFCVAVENFNADRDGAALKAAGFPKVSIDHKDEDDWLMVMDPDNIPVQILDNNYLADCTKCGVPPDDAAQPTPKDTIFKPSRIDHVGITVSDLQVSSDFYRKLFGWGPIRTLPPDHTNVFGWDIDGHLLSLNPTSKDKAGKITHFCLAVDHFNNEKHAAALKAAGFKVLPSTPDSVEWLMIVDPDGAIVQVLDTNFHSPCPNCSPPPVKA